MTKFRLGFIFLLLSLILMSCNLTSMLPFNQEEAISTVEEIAGGIMDQMEVEEESNNSIDQAPPPENNSPEENTAPMPTEEEPLDTTQNNTSSSTQSTACDHPYFPLRPGASWVYFEPEESYYHHWDVVRVEGDEQNATAVMTAYIGEFSELTEEVKPQMIRIEYNWVCSAEEGIVSFDMATLEIPEIEGQEFEMTLTFVDGEGVMLPPADKLNVGDTWDMTLQMNFSMPEMMDAEGTVIINDYYTVVNTNSVEFNGNEFEGLQYKSEFDMEIEINFGETSTSMPTDFVDFQTTTTMAKGVGFVTIDNDGDFGATGLQLVSYNIP